MRQDKFADWYFRITKSQHLTVLQAKAKRLCKGTRSNFQIDEASVTSNLRMNVRFASSTGERSGIKKRYLHHVEEMMDGHLETLDRQLPLLGTRMGIAADAVQELAAAAAARAIAAWGRPAGNITHLVVTTNSGAQSPGVDIHLAKILGLNPAVQRTLLYFHGCSAGAAALRIAKDIAENNHGARVLVACADVALVAFQAPDEADLGAPVVHSLVGDGAGAIIVGTGSASTDERPVFHMVSSSQVMLPGTDGAVDVQVRESGLHINLSAELPALVRTNIKQCLTNVLAPLGLPGGSIGWNDLFWVAHPGGRAILDSYEAALGLKPGKLAASRSVLSDYGNMAGATIIFVLDELRRRRDVESSHCEWGVLLGLGPGLTIETMVLRATTGQDGN